VAPPRAPADLASIEHAHDVLRLSYFEIARALHADETTLHRWRRGASAPSPVFAARLTALARCVDALGRAYPHPAEAGAWLAAPHPMLGAQSPREALDAGEIGLVTGALLAGALWAGAPLTAAWPPARAAGREASASGDVTRQAAAYDRRRTPNGPRDAGQARGGGTPGAEVGHAERDHG
jgi:uncharacterized protein (DUF2384 family)